MPITLIGDIHGKTGEYEKIIRENEKTLQLGDFGIGFVEIPPLGWGANHKAIRGNHDNPMLAIEHSHFLPSFGVWNDIFHIGGTESIDRWTRTEGVDWWSQEEMSYGQLQIAIDYYKYIKPNFVVSHDCPQSIFNMLIPDGRIGVTRAAMQAMFDGYPPMRWVFAHHHRSWQDTIRGCHFQCLDELEVLEVSCGV